MEFLTGFDDDPLAATNEGGKADEWTSTEEVQEATQRALQLAHALQRPSRAALVLNVYQDLIEEICGDICFSMHRAAKLSVCSSDASAKGGEAGSLVQRVVADPGFDVFGAQHYPAAATDEVQCDNCERKVQAGRYAPHLAKCLGKGRNCQRAASRRLSSMAQQNQQQMLLDDDDIDIDGDGDGQPFGKKKKKKKPFLAAVDADSRGDKPKKKKRKKIEALVSGAAVGGAAKIKAKMPVVEELHNIDGGFAEMEFSQWPFSGTESRETTMVAGDETMVDISGADNFVDLSGA